MSSLEELYPMLRARLLVSCQSWENDAFEDASCMARFARAAVEGGAAGIRADSPEEIRAIRQAVSVPIVGIAKVMQDDGRILITPSFEGARQLIEAGANLVAVDCTSRGQRFGAFERLRRIKAELGVPVLADIATVEEAVQAAEAGADAVLSTLRGYTPETTLERVFDPAFIADLARAVSVPVIAEGRVVTPRQACEALDAGAYAVIVGTAITRPAIITHRFVSALQARKRGRDPQRTFIGIDLGGTSTKFGLVNNRGDLLFNSATPTPWKEGREALLSHLKQVAATCLEEAQRRATHPEAIGLATAGWVDPQNGLVVYATENLPGWTGANPASYLREAFNLPVAAENDANALAVAEKHFGAAQAASDFVCITLGTGVGGGCYIAGQLHRGRHFFANALGHVPIEPGGLPCTCGLSGCLEPYANSSALLRYAGASKFASAEQVIAAANSGDSVAQDAIRTLAGYLAIGCSSIVSLFDPEMLILGGGLAQDNPFLLEALSEELAKRVLIWPERKLRVEASPLGYSAGVLGAAAVASVAAANSCSAACDSP
jgi:glucokinase-like ROK family protein